MPAPTSTTTSADIDRQIDALIALGAPELAKLTEPAFRDLLAPLAATAPDLPQDIADRIPVVLVLSPDLVRPEALLGLITVNGKPAFTSMPADDLARFRPVTEPVDDHAIAVPDGPAYLLTDVDTGRAYLNVPPQDAWGPIVRAGRSPLTLEEGVAVLAQQPTVLRDHSCFSMLGSRCGDRRVTALWVSDRRPRLGWCWTGAPHSWLGSASCAGRLPVPSP